MFGLDFFKFKRWEVIFLIIFLPIGIYLYSAGEGYTYSIKTKKGSTIKFDKNNVSCEKVSDFSIQMQNIGSKSPPPQKIVNIKCNANGILTDLTGRKYPYSSEKYCTLDKNEYIPCLAGEYFEKYNPNEKGIVGELKLPKKNNFGDNYFPLPIRQSLPPINSPLYYPP